MPAWLAHSQCMPAACRFTVALHQTLPGMLVAAAQHTSDSVTSLWASPHAVGRRGPQPLRGVLAGVKAAQHRLHLLDGPAQRAGIEWLCHCSVSLVCHLAQPASYLP